jgi:hypothetical protein
MTTEFISEDDLLTFEGWSKYQGADLATMPPDELTIWKECFEQEKRARETSPKVGLMKLRRVPGQEQYAVAIRDGSDLWLTLWVRCSRKGEIFILYPRGDRSVDAHASYHEDGTLHQKSYGHKGLAQQRQPLQTFKGSEHLGMYSGHGKGNGAVCDPNAFDGVVIVEPGILGPANSSVGIDLLEAGYEGTWSQNVADRYYFGTVHQREVFRRNPRPAVVITIHAPEPLTAIEQ